MMWRDVRVAHMMAVSRAKASENVAARFGMMKSRGRDKTRRAKFGRLLTERRSNQAECDWPGHQEA